MCERRPYAPGGSPSRAPIPQGDGPNGDYEIYTIKPEPQSGRSERRIVSSGEAQQPECEYNRTGEQHDDYHDPLRQACPRVQRWSSGTTKTPRVIFVLRVINMRGRRVVRSETLLTNFGERQVEVRKKPPAHSGE